MLLTTELWDVLPMFWPRCAELRWCFIVGADIKYGIIDVLLTRQTVATGNVFSC